MTTHARLGALFSLALLLSACGSGTDAPVVDAPFGGSSGHPPGGGLGGGGSGSSDAWASAIANAHEEGAYATLVAEARGAGATSWSDPASWGGKQPPSAGSDVVVGAGKTVILDRSVNVRTLRVDGTLICADRDLRVRAGSVMVHGILRCGSADAPYEKRMTLTLTGPTPDSNEMGMGSKVLGAMGGGALELHGLPRKSWVKLRATAPKGTTRIELAADVDWRKGDRLVLASTDFDMNQAEEREVVSVSGRTVTLDRPLDFMHFGRKLTYQNAALGQKFAIDQRGEVALLNRNIVIEGDETSVDSRRGAHVMVMVNSSMHVSNVELRRVGQAGKLGRYPLHWHLARDVPGQYIRNSSIHHSYNRCITIHGTNRAVVANNVCYDHVGHGFFLEDGSETGNVLTGNLGLVTRKPANGEALLASDTAKRGTEPLGPSTYWLINPDNTLRGNVAAGSDGSGFWYGIASSAVGFSAALDIRPNKTPLKEFRSNTVHSTAGMAAIFGASPDPKGSGYFPPTVPVLEKLTYYKTRTRGLWTHVGRMDVDGLYAADNTRGAFFSFGTRLENALFVGESANVGNPVTPLETKLGRSLANAKGSVAGYVLYDGPANFENVLFAGFGRNAENVYVFGNNGAGTQHMNNEFRRIGFAADTKRVFPTAAQQGFSNFNGERHGSIIDVDGSISGNPGSYLLPNFPMNTNQRCARGPWSSPDWTSCENRYGVLEMYYARFAAGQGAETVPVHRSGGARNERPSWELGAGKRKDAQGDWWEYEMGVIVDQNYLYRWDFSRVAFPRTANIRLIDLPSGARVVLQLAGAPSNVSLFDGDALVPEAASLNGLRSGKSPAWFRSGSDLYILVVSGSILTLER